MVSRNSADAAQAVSGTTTPAAELVAPQPDTTMAAATGTTSAAPVEAALTQDTTAAPEAVTTGTLVVETPLRAETVVRAVIAVRVATDVREVRVAAEAEVEATEAERGEDTQTGREERGEGTETHVVDLGDQATEVDQEEAGDTVVGPGAGADQPLPGAEERLTTHPPPPDQPPSPLRPDNRAVVRFQSSARVLRPACGPPRDVTLRLPRDRCPDNPPST